MSTKRNSSKKPPLFDLPAEFPGAIWYDQEEIDAVVNVMKRKSPFRYYGPQCGFEVKAFEQEFARFLASSPGSPWPDTSCLYVTSVNSGTGALEVALDALGVGCGDEVIVQGFMWIASIGAIVRSRAIPVLVDSDNTLNMDPEKIKAKITERTKVVMPVPMLGGCAQIGRIMNVIREVNADRIKRKLPLVRVLEDNCQCLGAWANGIPGSVSPEGTEKVYRIGNFGDIAVFSLQINKNMTAGEGGMVVTRDPELARRVEALHNVGYAKDSHGGMNWYGDVPLGWGQGRRMTEMQGAIARVQLRKLDSILLNMRASHSRLESFVQKLGLIPRMHADSQSPGDTGYYCIFHLPEASSSDEEKINLGRNIATFLAEYHLHPWFLHDFEVHVYYNIPSLIEKVGLNGGCPWACEKNSFHTQYSYNRGTLPHLDDLFVSSIGINVPSKLTVDHEKKIMAVLEYMTKEYLGM